TCGILAAYAVDAYLREVDFFKSDMRLDHVMVGELLGTMIRNSWDAESRTAAVQLPDHVDQGGRRLQLSTILPEAPGWTALPATTRARLMAHGVVAERDRGSQTTLMPVFGTGGDLLMVLGVGEPLAEEAAFSHASLVRSVLVTIGVVLLFAVFTLV